MRDGPTSLVSWGLAIATALESRGVASRDLFLAAGLDPAELGDPEARYPLSSTTKLWRGAVEATRDPAFGLEVARHTNFNTFHALGFSLATSGTLMEAFERVVRYFDLVTDAAAMSLERGGDHVRFTVRLKDGASPADEAVDAFMAVCVRMFRALTHRRMNPLDVQLRRVAPADPAAFARYFRVPVRFEAPLDTLVFAREVCEARLLTANPELARVNEAIVVAQLARLAEPSFEVRVRQAIVEALPHGEPSQAAVARRLGQSLRSMQRKLAAGQTSYTELLDETRRELALGYIEDRRYSISEITYLLGFAGASNFSRAFKRWTALSPREYRARAEGRKNGRAS